MEEETTNEPPTIQELMNLPLNTKINNFLEKCLKTIMNKVYVEHYERNILGILPLSKNKSQLSIMTKNSRKSSMISNPDTQY